MSDIGYPTEAFWSVVDDICEQAERHWQQYPHDKAVEVQVIRPDIEELRAALGSPR